MRSAVRCTTWKKEDKVGRATSSSALRWASRASIASSAGSIVVSKVREQSNNLMLTTGWSMFWGTCMVAHGASRRGQAFIIPRTASYVLGLLHLSLFGSVVAFICYFTLINRIGSNKAVYIGVITPVLSVLMSIRLEHYRPGLIEWLGMAVCLGSVAWALHTPKRQGHLPST
jgi:drug/metabolite transporter (DMT)-like permease